MNNQYMPKYVKVKQINRPDGSVCYLEKDHINAIEDTLMYENKRVGKRIEESGTDLVTVLNHIMDDASGYENRIDNIKVNEITQIIDEDKNVNITVPTSLSQLSEDEQHRTVKDTDKSKWNNKQDALIFQSGNYDKNTNKVITKSDLDTAIEPLSRATKWRGVFTSLENVSEPQHADVASLQNGKEYVYSTQSGSGQWIELGDTSDCIHKNRGELKNGDVSDDAAISQSKIAGLTNSLDSKVDKVDNCSLVADTEIAKIHSHDNKAVLDAITQETWNNVVESANKTEEDPVFTDWKNGKTITAGENTSGTEGCVAIGYGAEAEGGAQAEDWGTAIGVGSFSRCGLAIGPDAKAGIKGDDIKIAATAIGRYSQALASCATAIGGGHNSSNAAIADKEGAVQIGLGTNSVANSLQFQDTPIVVNGTIPDESLQTNPSNKADKSTTIAGIDLQDDITKAELLNALNVEDGAKANKIEIVKVNGNPQDISKTDKSVDIIVDTPTEANTDEITAATKTDKYISPNKNKFATMTGLLKNADDESLSESNQQKLQNWLGTNELIFTFSDNSTKRFKFVCSEVSNS